MTTRRSADAPRDTGDRGGAHQPLNAFAAHAAACPVAAASLHARQDAAPGRDWDLHPDLTVDLDRALDSLDEPTPEWLLARANH